MAPALYNGSRLIVSINGTQVAAGFVASYSITTGTTEIDTLDYVVTRELAPSRIRVSMQMQVYRLPDNDPIASNFAPGANNINSVEQTAFTQMRYISVDIKDELDNTVFMIPKAQIVQRSGSVSVGNFLTESWSIQGIGYYSTL